MAFRERIILTKGGVTDIDVYTVVNEANTDLILGVGVVGAIRKKGSPSIQEECNRIGKIPLGEAAVTAAGNLKAKFVIHAAAMGFRNNNTKESLKIALLNSLKSVIDKNIKNFTFPATGIGIGGFSLNEGSRILLKTVISFLSENLNLKKVYVFLFGERMFGVFRGEFEDLIKDFEN